MGGKPGLAFGDSSIWRRVLGEDLCIGTGYLLPPTRLYSQRGWYMALNLRGLSHEWWIPSGAYLYVLWCIRKAKQIKTKSSVRMSTSFWIKAKQTNTYGCSQRAVVEDRLFLMWPLPVPQVGPRPGQRLLPTNTPYRSSDHNLCAFWHKSAPLPWHLLCAGS